jgi:hypothetical protein
MDPLSGEDSSLGPDLWTEHEPECKEYFPPREKCYFQSLRDDRPYDSKKPVKWPRCMHNELCVMQVYEGVGFYYSGRRFWHCPRAWVSNTTTSISISLFR